MEEKDFVKMEPALKTINKAFTLEDSKKQYINSLNEIKTEFLQALRAEDPILNYYKKTQLTEEKINIKGGYEFDLNVCIKLPFDCSQLNLKNGPSPGVVTIQIPGQLDILKRSPQWENFKSVDLWMDKDDYVLQNRLREWMRSVSMKAIDALKKSPSLIWSKYEVEIKAIGRKITLYFVHRQSNIKFSVNLFPALVFKETIWPSRVPKKYATEYSIDEWHAIPGQDSSCEPALSGKLWWVSFSQQECNMLKGKGQLKITQQLIELLRESCEFTFIKSYVINNLFMLMVEQKKGDSSFWQKNLGYLFMVMLTDLHDKVSKARIPCFWDRDYNMLSSTKPNQLNNCKQSLQGSIKFIMKNYADHDKILNHLLPARICGSNENGLTIKLIDKSGSNFDRDTCKEFSNKKLDVKLYDKCDEKINEQRNVQTNIESDVRLKEECTGKTNEESDVYRNEDHDANLDEKIFEKSIEEQDIKHNEDCVKNPKLYDKCDEKINEKHNVQTNIESDARLKEECTGKTNEESSEYRNEDHDANLDENFFVKSIEEQDIKHNEDCVKKPNKENDVKFNDTKLNKKRDMKSNNENDASLNKECPVKSVEKYDINPNANNLIDLNGVNCDKFTQEQDIKINIEHGLETNKENNSSLNEKHDYVQLNSTNDVKLANTNGNSCILS